MAGEDLCVRELEQVEPRVLVARASPTFPFWSPDSRQVAYIADEKLWRVPVSGGEPILVADAAFARGGTTPGGVWLADGTIVFAPAANGSGLLYRPVPGGGQLTTFLERDASESDFHKPSVLPDGHTLVFVIDANEGGAYAIGALRRGQRKTLLALKGQVLNAPVYSPTGHLLFVREGQPGGIWAIPFSPERLEVSGEAFPVAPAGHWPTLASDGTLVYAEPRDLALELVRLDLSGRVLATIGNAPGLDPQRHVLASRERAWPRRTPKASRSTTSTGERAPA